MTGGPVVRFTPEPGRELLAQVCTRCSGVGTHYLTCPSLRLPAGYRPGEDIRGDSLISGGEAGDPAGRPGSRGSGLAPASALRRPLPRIGRRELSGSVYRRLYTYTAAE